MVNISNPVLTFFALHASLFRQSNDTGNCLMSLNSSCSKAFDSVTVYVLLYAFVAVVVFFTMCGNLFVIISVCHFKQLHTPTNILILSLALSDFLVGILMMPVHLRFCIEPCLLYEPSYCAFYNMMGFHLTFVSVYNISFIAVDRYFALSNPFLYSKKVSVCLACVITIHIWIVSLFYNSALLYVNGNFNHKCPRRFLPYMNELWSTADLIAVFILPCVIIITLYMNVFFIARRHAVAIRATLKDGKRMGNHNKGNLVRLETKAAKAVGILVSVFLIFLIPYYICTLLFDALGQSYNNVVNITLFLFFLNSSINPIIYALFYPWFQKCVKLILIFRICRTNSSLINVLSSDH